MQSYISDMVYSVIPIIVYVFPLLVWPYAKTLAEKQFHIIFVDVIQGKAKFDGEKGKN